MVLQHLLTAKLAELEERVARVEGHCPDSVDALSSDRDALDIVSFNLMLAVQSCADIASHLIADEGWPPAKSLSEGFGRLEERAVLEPPTAARLKQAVGLRNVVAQGYAGIDPRLVAATSGLADLRAFARQIAAWLVARSS